MTAVSYGDGIDRYEAERIARDEASRVAEEVRRDVWHDLERVRDDLRRARADASAEQSMALDDVWAAIGSLGARVDRLAEGLKTLDAMRLDE